MAGFIEKIKGIVVGLIGKIKGLFGGSKGEGEGTPSPKVEALKETAGKVKDKVDVLVDKAGEKMPDKVKDTFEKVSDKAEKIIPGKKDSDAGDAAAAVVAPDETAPAENPYMPDEVVDAASDAADAVADAASDTKDAVTDAASDAKDAVTE